MCAASVFPVVPSWQLGSLVSHNNPFPAAVTFHRLAFIWPGNMPKLKLGFQLKTDAARSKTLPQQKTARVTFSLSQVPSYEATFILN